MNRYVIRATSGEYYSRIRDNDAFIGIWKTRWVDDLEGAEILNEDEVGHKFLEFPTGSATMIRVVRQEVPNDD